MKTFLAGLVVLCSVVCASAQETAPAGALNEKRVPLSEAAVALDAAGAPALEAYPLDSDLTPSTSHTGYVSTFKRAGFKIVARHVPPRPIMRYDFQ